MQQLVCMAEDPTPTAAEPVQMNLALERARRTAFVARFIVLREGKRTRAHRIIEGMDWDDRTTAEELCAQFRQVFVDNGDKLGPVDRDLRRAMAHADRVKPHRKEVIGNREIPYLVSHFIYEYQNRATTNFIDALFDYERSNALLFGDDGDQPKPGGWHLPRELLKARVRNSKAE